MHTASRQTKKNTVQLSFFRFMDGIRACGLSAASPYLTALRDVFTLLHGQLCRGIDLFFLTWIFNTRPTFEKHIYLSINVTANVKIINGIEAARKTLPSKRIPEATHSKTRRRDSPTPIGLSDVQIAFSTSSSRGYGEKRAQTPM